MRNKLAIIGCANHTRDWVDYSDPDLDIWVFNESCSKDWCKRADAVFQLHEPAIWKNPLNRGDADHGKWLMSGNTPTIYMLEAYPEVPKAVRLPREDIVEALLPGLTVDSERARKDFFTSTIAYSLAMGIYLGYKEIHTYGVELADESEYREQLPCAMFWMGIALGRGVKIFSHSQMFDAPLYPLETYVGMSKDEFSKAIEEIKPQADVLKAKVLEQQQLTEIAIRKYEESGSGRDEVAKSVLALADIAKQFGEKDGAYQENKRYFDRAIAMEEMTSTYVFSRHEFVRDQAAIGVRREQMVGELHGTAAAINKLIEGIDAKKFDSARRHEFKDLRNQIEIFIKMTVMYWMYTGAIGEDERFIKKIEELRAEAKNVNKTS